MSIQRRREDWKIEVIDGKKIVAMSPAFSNHNTVKLNISTIFSVYLDNSLCMGMPDDTKVVLDDSSYVEPDFLVVCDRDKIKKEGVHGAPDLVVEVLSPSTAKYDKGVKKDKYQEAGVKEYWLVEPDMKFIEVYLLKDSVYYLDEVYRYPDPLESKEEQETAITEFHVKTFPDLVVTLDRVFKNVFDW